MSAVITHNAIVIRVLIYSFAANVIVSSDNDWVVFVYFCNCSFTSHLVDGFIRSDLQIRSVSNKL